MSFSTAKVTIEFEQLIYSTMFGGSPNIKICLLQDVSAINLTGLNPKQNFFANELTHAAYTRQNYVLGSNSYNPTNKRIEGATTPAAVNPSASISYNGLFLVYGGSPNKPATVTPNSGTSQFGLTSHGLTDGEQVCIFTQDGVLPTGVTSAIKYAKVINSNTFEIYTDVGLTTKVNFSDVGTGTIKLGYAKGTVMAFGITASTETVLASQVTNIAGNFFVMNSGDVSGV